MDDVTDRALVQNTDRPRAMNGEATADSQNYRITIYIAGWVIKTHEIAVYYTITFEQRKAGSKDREETQEKRIQTGPTRT